MAGIFAFIFLGCLIALPISLIKPDIFSRFVNSTRKKNALFFSTIGIISFILFGITTPPAPLSATDVQGAQTTVAPKNIPVATLIPTDTLIPTLSPTLIPTLKPTTAPTIYPTAKPTTIIYPTSTPVPTVAPQQPSQTSGGYTCDCSKACPEISSCSEAQYQLNTCGCGARDNDNDGIACDGAPLHCQN